MTMRAIVGTAGAAGGHGTMAGARLFAKIRSARTLNAEFERLVAKLCEVTNQPGVPSVRLLAGPNGKTESGSTGHS